MIKVLFLDEGEMWIYTHFSLREFLYAIKIGLYCQGTILGWVEKR